MGYQPEGRESSDEAVDRVLYARATYGKEEKQAVADVLETPKQLAGGDYTEEFEDAIASSFGKRYGVMTNSGSSANLLAIESLQLSDSAEVITPITTFSTTVAPLVQKGLTPVFIDISIGTYQIQVEKIEEAITDETEAILIPALAGNIPDWPRLEEIANEHDLYLIEDSADTIGATIQDEPTGTFTDVSTTSFYGSHVITAFGGGGMVCFADATYADMAKKLRGWGRKSAVDEDLTIDERFRTQLGDITYDEKFVFDEVGYNFLPLEASAAFGLEQFQKLDEFARRRQENFIALTDFFEQYEEWFVLPKERDDVKTCWLAYPLTIKERAPFNRVDIVKYLETNGIQTRSLWAGNILCHPGFKDIDCRVPFETPTADRVMKNAFVIGCHQSIGDEELSYMKKVFETFFEGRSE
ncbi:MULTISPECIES: aminotransferase class I/II-fold pyridoxal phosphate-dependent enzyme [unclassified Natrinema]|uniref:aminotransferase class I/II-fold pyridoxal phosphate-dependent enzyme n=1 Tax=unclassified Natrinema TaxID=2622230 RepID=UPI00026D47E1|nr:MULTISPECIES: aminotransferase class I/II-fold pyridoxal phosphate-dependent enzyme [unclassified Natrinema]AFO59136.1 NDP-hexose 3,4-dehydratase [Natrinema sp. J7-2]